MRLRRLVTPARLGAPVAFALTFTALAALLPAQGLTDDDDFYAPAGIRYARWLGDAITEPGRALSEAAVTAAFKVNSEHPPLAKVVFGLSHALFHEALGLTGALDGARMGAALLGALISALLVGLLWAPLGAATAIAAPLLLWSLPRFTFHAQVATLDVPVACAVLAVTASFFRAEITGRRGAALVAGLVFGLALLVKLNAPFALIPCVAVAVLGRWRGFSIKDGSIVVPPLPQSVLWMLLLGPMLFVALWPWLWFHTFERLAAWIAFHLHHYPIYMFYDGEIWERPFAPWHAVFVHGLGAMPIPVVALGLMGVGRGLAALLRMGRSADATGALPDVSAADRLRALLLLQALMSVVLVANPSTPRYGGEKLFMPFFPMFCALAADGGALVADAVRAWLPRARGAAQLLVVALAAIPGFAGSIKHHGGFALSYYGESLGGLRGAVARGHERTYYDVTDKALARLLDAQATGLKVHFEPNHKEYVRTYRWLRGDGITRNVTLVPDRAAADIIVLTHERRWPTYAALLEEISAWGTATHEHRIDGVPLYTIYRRR